MNKKGELSDMLIFLITIFALAIGLFILMFVTPKISDGLRVAGLNNSQEGNAAVEQLDNIGSNVINNGFLMLFVGLIISVFITSFLVRTHPIFLFLYIFLLGITVVLAFYLGNTYETFKNNEIFADMVENASFINIVMKYIAEITVAVGALSMIIVFSKFSSNNTSGGLQY